MVVPVIYSLPMIRNSMLSFVDGVDADCSLFKTFLAPWHCIVQIIMLNLMLYSYNEFMNDGGTEINRNLTGIVVRAKRKERIRLTSHGF